MGTNTELARKREGLKAQVHSLPFPGMRPVEAAKGWGFQYQLCHSPTEGLL